MGGGGDVLLREIDSDNVTAGLASGENRARPWAARDVDDCLTGSNPELLDELLREGQTARVIAVAQEPAHGEARVEIGATGLELVLRHGHCPSLLPTFVWFRPPFVLPPRTVRDPWGVGSSNGSSCFEFGTTGATGVPESAALTSSR